jgi:hypothetical protein
VEDSFCLEISIYTMTLSAVFCASMREESLFNVTSVRGLFVFGFFSAVPCHLALVSATKQIEEPEPWCKNKEWNSNMCLP